MNQVIMVGRIVNIKNDEKTIVTIAVTRQFKNSDGEYETDLVPVILYGTISETTFEYCKKDDIIGIRGRVQIENDKIVLIADRVTFLSSKKEEDNE